MTQWKNSNYTFAPAPISAPRTSATSCPTATPRHLRRSEIPPPRRRSLPVQDLRQQRHPADLRHRGRRQRTHPSIRTRTQLDPRRESYDRQQPAHSNIAAIENSDVLLWPKSDFDSLLSTIPQLKDLSQQLISRNIYNSRQRILTALSATPEEKYQEFVQTFPDYLARLPLHMIASYLGISIKTLTRIRQAQLRR
ncbi:Crp/Fnr family transcriptional regulator [Puia sp. P3]|uniref:Crp/Fnr family transcriptional regulator n=1 Tax=Puia sp. P3 TaxID=3423952 RepID=UPI003D67CEC5